jgi:hypothetical protein
MVTESIKRSDAAIILIQNKRASYELVNNLRRDSFHTLIFKDMSYIIQTTKRHGMKWHSIRCFPIYITNDSSLSLSLFLSSIFLHLFFIFILKFFIFYFFNDLIPWDKDSDWCRMWELNIKELPCKT